MCLYVPAVVRHSGSSRQADHAGICCCSIYIYICACKGYLRKGIHTYTFALVLLRHIYILSHTHAIIITTSLLLQQETLSFILSKS